MEILLAELIQSFFDLFDGNIGLGSDKKWTIPSIPIIENVGIINNDGEIVKRSV